MHMLYLDESGSVPDPNQCHFVLAGVSVFERKTHWIEQKLNMIASRFDPQNPYSLELHGSPMRSGRDGWDKFKFNDRAQAIKDCLHEGIQKEKGKGVSLFGVVIKKAAAHGKDPVEMAFEQISNRFDLFLKRRYLKYSDPQRGIIILDKSSTEPRIQVLARNFKYLGTTWGSTKNYAEVPVFLDSRASRLIQLADLVAYSIFRKYEANDSLFFDVISNCFDSEGSTIHGLYEKL